MMRMFNKSHKLIQTNWVYRLCACLVYLCIITMIPYAADPGAYRVDDAMMREAMQLYHSPEPADFVVPATHPDAQWFPKAGFGLFMHWGIHSVDGVDPSWALIKDCPWHKPNFPYKAYADDRTKYYHLAEKFNPEKYDPDLWIKAAKEAGFQYAVLTTKHHDGFALWPSKYGDLNTKRYAGGRDLLKPYVEACRKYGLKVGFYFSPRDWHYPGYPQSFEYGKPYIFSPEEKSHNEENFKNFYAYTIGQIHELLTQYGKIDLLWFDGMGWDGISDTKQKQTLAWIRRLQPGIVINPRWSGLGDFKTTECEPGKPKDYKFGEWWEACDIWMQGSWGYVPSEQFKSLSWVFERLVNSREWGGNFLCNVGPRPDGRMPENFYANCKSLAEWMKQNRESVINTDPVPETLASNIPCTRQGKTLYAHILKKQDEPVILKNVDKPQSVIYLRDHSPMEFTYENRTLSISVKNVQFNGMDEVIKMQF